MRFKRIYPFLVAVLLMALLCAFTGDIEKMDFVVPKGWPQPIYDFSKNKLTVEKFKLGRKLFFDPVLSRDSSTSCSSCHLQFTGFTHGDHALSHGINGLKGTRNSLTLFNLAWSRSFMWDGGVTNLETQPLNPITNPVEMDNTLDNIIRHLSYSATYKVRFREAFGDTVITGQRILKSLAQFVVMLESYNSKYDKHMRGEPGGELSAQEQKGLSLFKSNCVSCHPGPLFTSQLCESNELPPDPELNDIGRMKITHNKADSLKFKVPTLRNIATSGPYMHDGRFNTLDEVLDHYITVSQAPGTRTKNIKAIRLSAQDKKDVIAFLQTLTDKEFLFDLRFRNYME